MLSYFFMAVAVVGGMWLVNQLPLSECDNRAMQTGVFLITIFTWLRLDAYFTQQRKLYGESLSTEHERRSPEHEKMEDL